MNRMKDFIVQNKGLSVLIFVLAIMASQIVQTSIRSERYGFLLVILLIVAIGFGGVISAHRNSKKPHAERFHPTKLWARPYETTRAGLWLRAAFSALTLFLAYAGLMALSCLYWNARRWYEPVSTNQTRREWWTVALGIVATSVTLLVLIGMWLS